MTSAQAKAAVEQLRLHAANRPREEKEQLGQFLTPPAVARLVASLFRPLSPRAPVRILDPGAGTGALSFAFVEWAAQQAHRPASLEIVAVELDDRLIPTLCETLKSCEALAASVGIKCSTTALHANFLRACIEQSNLFSSPCLPNGFSHVIMNPPYRKIGSDSEERELLSQSGIEVSNIYAGFVALAASLLRPEGELSAITPRSFCNGTYFRDFRRRLLSSTVIDAAHVFVSRKKAFAADSVLQENVIFAARRSRLQADLVSVRSSDGPDAPQAENRVPYATVFPSHDRDVVIHLPTDSAGTAAMEFVTSLPAQLEDLGLTVSTGPVVDFRARNQLCARPGQSTVPLIYPAHFSRAGIEWPIDGRKPNAIIRSPKTEWSLIPLGNYVLTKRFTSKEERKRIVARVLEQSPFSQHARIGLENHLNFFHSRGRGLDLDLAFGLATYLNSTVADVYFRQFNGHTQVNAGDLRMMLYPCMEQLRQLGVKARESREAVYQQATSDRLLEQIIQGI